MLGTLNGALSARETRLDPKDIRATAAGTNELIDGIVRLTRIDIHYTLRIPAGTREKVDRALARHREKCPTARSLEAAVRIEWTADISESD
ncbi:MAG: OsmC family protein [Gemmatimonadetes bacterium]|nr:OsmC family protein [Gemmatimonadota bacterium]